MVSKQLYLANKAYHASSNSPIEVSFEEGILKAKDVVRVTHMCK